jgi:magnesium chelatase subunit D
VRLEFPWSAVIGQERLKLALLLCAIDPSIGGVLVQGPRGVAKTTLARAFAALLPGRFVELPLGATEERVTGTLDLGRALQDGQVEFAPGLLAREHEVVLYVDEVNLLPDALVDLLLDAAATGTNVVERDGVSREHPARFVLVGTMNPEEGELRPQFVDRFGLAVTAESEIPPAERAQIVLRRLEFERDPERFTARFAVQQHALGERCRLARERAATLEFVGPGLERVAELCHAARVEGVRADLAMLRAARAHAVWEGRSLITVADVDAVAELALGHRRRGAPGSSAPGSASSSGASERRSGPGAGAKTEERQGSAARGAREALGRGGDAVEAGQGNAGTISPGVSPQPNPTAQHSDAGPHPSGTGPSRGALRAVAVRAMAVERLPPGFEADVFRGARLRRRHALRVQRRRAAPTPPVVARAGIDWFGTLLACGNRPKLAELRFRERRGAPEQLWIVALDCSASMLTSGALALAKGVVQALVQSTLSPRSHVALISFSQQLAQTEIISRSRRSALADAIAGLGAGGGTPLRQALESAFAVAARPAYRGNAIDKCLLLLTDGRTREDVSDMQRRCRELPLTVIDCERGTLRLGRSRSLATALAGRLLAIDSLLGPRS